jgi:hypothetical protein
VNKIYPGSAFCETYKPLIANNWGHNSAQASMIASENRERRVAGGCLHSMGGIDMPGTPTTPAPKNQERPLGYIFDQIKAMLRRPCGATAVEISRVTKMNKTQAGKRIGRFNAELVRKGCPPLDRERTGDGQELRYWLIDEASL